MADVRSQVLSSCCHLMKTGNTHYIIPSSQSMRDILRNVYRNDISSDSYYRYMRDLEDKGFIARQFRYDTTVKPQIRRLPSLIAFTLKGARYLMLMGVTYAFKIYKQIKAYLDTGSKRFPHAELFKKNDEKEEIDWHNNLGKLRDLIRQQESVKTKYQTKRTGLYE